MGKRGIKPKELKDFLDKNNTIIIDVRSKGYYLIDHIKDSINIENCEKIGVIAKENKDKKVILYCHHGITAGNFVNELAKNNIDNIYYVDGSFSEITKTNVNIIYHT